MKGWVGAACPGLSVQDMGSSSERRGPCDGEGREGPGAATDGGQGEWAGGVQVWSQTHTPHEDGEGACWAPRQTRNGRLESTLWPTCPRGLHVIPHFSSTLTLGQWELTLSPSSVPGTMLHAFHVLSHLSSILSGLLPHSVDEKPEAQRCAVHNGVKPDLSPLPLLHTTELPCLSLPALNLRPAWRRCPPFPRLLPSLLPEWPLPPPGSSVRERLTSAASSALPEAPPQPACPSCSP